MNELAKLNESRKNELERLCSIRVAEHAARRRPSEADYPLLSLFSAITQAIEARTERAELDPQFDVIDRKQFGGDIAVKVPSLLKEKGAKHYIATYIPSIVETLTGPEFANSIERVEAKGIYVNLKLRSRWLLDAVQTIVDLGDAFGHTDSCIDRAYVVDYSSPNVAKTLHAGHIRSTIIGHVLCNLYEAAGALVYRVNHINDFGGFGFILEGLRRFADKFPAGMSENQRLLEIYTIRRTLERYAAESIAFAEIPERDRELIQRYFPGVTSKESLQRAFEEYVTASDARFERLEEGDADEVVVWKAAVEHSLADFQSFYDALMVHIDLTLGESFYFNTGVQLVEDALAAGTAVVFTEALARPEIEALERQHEAGEISRTELDKRVSLITKDIGAVVVQLPDGERLVVRRADGRSIYATRDLAAVKLRRELFDPTDIIYVVGQEQRVHFARLFQAAEVVGLVHGGDVHLEHVYFGFYVDAKDGKKLSSRNAVSNVNHLLEASVEFFKNRFENTEGLTPEELDVSSRQLAVGSLVFNDLKQDMKGSVEIATSNIQETIEAFEKSGGAYVVYAACRARSIIRKYGREYRPELPRASEIESFEFSDQEVALILALLDIPTKISRAIAQNSPSVLVRYLLDVANAYNSYYHAAQVLTKETGANLPRVLLTKAVELTLVNGLRICHIECPPRL